MKTILIATALLLSNQIVNAEYFDVQITRTDINTYLVENWFDDHEYWLIKTQFCDEYAYYDDAVLSYSWKGGYDNYLHFDNGYTCNFKEALKINVYD